MTKRPLNLDRYGQGSSGTRVTAFDALIAAAPAELEQRAKDLGLPLKHIPTEQIAPDLQQLRHLPHPDDLTHLAEDGDRAAQRAVAELRTLGQSMREHGQLQPIVVYPESGDARFPAMTHRIVMGQRRWSAAVLEQLPIMWVVEIERPSSEKRIRQQFDENEQRAGLCDMERAWALLALKEAIEEQSSEGVTWGVIEEGMKISTQRRQDLLRLMRFSSEGQAIIARYHWPESVLRPLHMAISANEINQDVATTILQELTGVEEVHGTTIREYVERYRRPHAQSTPSSIHDIGGAETTAANILAQRQAAARLSSMSRQIMRLRKGIDNFAEYGDSDIDDNLRQDALREIEGLMNSLEALLERLKP